MERNANSITKKDVVGALIKSNNLILLAQRSCDALNQKWEFPGGKVEPGESHAEALQREIFEELGIEISVGDRVSSNDFQVGLKKYCLHCYWAEILEGKPVADEHHSIEWVEIDNLLEYDLAPADIPIARGVIDDWRN